MSHSQAIQKFHGFWGAVVRMDLALVLRMAEYKLAVALAPPIDRQDSSIKV